MTVEGKSEEKREGAEKGGSPRLQPVAEICSAEEHYDKFNPLVYLESFYKSAKEDMAMQIILYFLPSVSYRLPQKVSTVLDLGAGPTVYLPIALRNRSDKMYTSDYAPANRDTLQAWVENRSSFNWSDVCRSIADLEATMETAESMQQTARQKMQAILEVNVQADTVIKSLHWKATEEIRIPEKFQVVATVFCLEYSCETLEGYQRAVRNAASLVEDGGYLLQGGVLDSTDYSFGGKAFKCHCLQKEHIMDALKENEFTTEEGADFRFLEHENIFLMISKKLTVH